MLTHSVNRDMVKSLAEVDVAAIQAHDSELSEYFENPWSYCTVYIAVHYAGFIGRSYLSKTSFQSQEAFERDPMYEFLVDTAIMNLCERIAKSLVQLQLVIEP